MLHGFSYSFELFVLIYSISEIMQITVLNDFMLSYSMHTHNTELYNFILNLIFTL